jgi:hypothetical protein
MNDAEQATSQVQAPPETLQEKLAKIKFVNPNTGQAHPWEKCAYVKGLARKIHQTLQLIDTE